MKPFKSDAEELEIVKALNRSLLIFDNQHRGKIAALQQEIVRLTEALEFYAHLKKNQAPSDPASS